MEEKLFNKIEEKLLEIEEKILNKLDKIIEELRLEFNQKFYALEARVGLLEKSTATNTNQGKTNQEKVDAIFKKFSPNDELPPPMPGLRLSLQGKPPPVPKRSSRTALQSVERLCAIESTESTITITWKSHSITDVEIECYEVQSKNVHGVWSTIKSRVSPEKILHRSRKEFEAGDHLRVDSCGAK
ncbi:hypothetical protein niasHS_010388 [Heterodera schachtii]|uniref:Fibronectin type-III domain-containing protein n=1 Tax=Heterodera schachtii TaxID=97005 RepID=A0ABD2IZM6_HETSC